ncbi:MAG: DUF1211 domain-containing protein [Rubrobacter sp.]|nr:DUF1211 domain-containing protein [Rubrobacter sp.]
MFAIAITLLMLEIRVPYVEDAPEGTSLLAALLGPWPSHLGYALSLLVIGTMWANHHNRFKLMVRSDHNLVLLNTLLLLCTAFIPFPTALLAGHIQGTEEQKTTAVASYSGTLAVTAVVFTLLWIYAANGYRLVDRHLDPALLRAMTRRYVLGMTLYTAAFALAFLNVVFSLALIAGLALLFVLPEPSSRAEKPEALSEDEPEAEKPGT